MVEDAIAKLSEVEKAVVRSLLYHRMTCHEVGAALGCKYGRIQKVWARAVAKMAPELDAQHLES